MKLTTDISKNIWDPLGCVESETKNVFDTMSYTDLTEFMEIVKKKNNVDVGVDRAMVPF